MILASQRWSVLERNADAIQQEQRTSCRDRRPRAMQAFQKAPHKCPPNALEQLIGLFAARHLFQHQHCNLSLSMQQEQGNLCQLASLLKPAFMLITMSASDRLQLRWNGTTCIDGASEPKNYRDQSQHNKPHTVMIQIWNHVMTCRIMRHRTTFAHSHTRNM